jgi:hypothetical protein
MTVTVPASLASEHHMPKKTTGEDLHFQRSEQPSRPMIGNGREVQSPDGGNAVFLDEDEVGKAHGKIGFPHIVLCQGVVCAMNNGTMIGAHFSSPNSQLQVSHKMINLINENGGPGEIKRMFVAYDSRHKPENMADAKQKAANFDFGGEVKFFDTATMKNKPTDGTYVEVAHDESGFQVEYAKSERMEHPKGTIGPGQKLQTVGAQIKPNLQSQHSLKSAASKTQTL